MTNEPSATQLYLRYLILGAISLAVLFPANLLISYFGLITDTPVERVMPLAVQAFVVGLILGPPLCLVLNRWGLLEEIWFFAIIAALANAYLSGKLLICAYWPLESAPYRALFEPTQSQFSQCLFYFLINVVLTLPKSILIAAIFLTLNTMVAKRHRARVST